MRKIRLMLIDLIFISFIIMTVLDMFNKFRFNFAISDILIVVLVILSIKDLKKIDKKFTIWFLIIFLYILISGFIAKLKPGVNTGSFLRLLSQGVKSLIWGLYFFIGYYSFKDLKEFKRKLNLWLVGTWIVLLTGIILQILAYKGFILNINEAISARTRFMGTITDANLASVYLSMSFFISLILYSLTNKKYQKLYLLITSFFCTVGIILTQSRGGLLGFAIGLLTYLIVNFNKQKKITRYLTLFFVTVILFLILFDIDITYTDGKLFDDIIGRVFKALEGGGQFQVRKNLSISALNMGLDNFWFGVGSGNYPLNSLKYLEPLGITKESSEYIYTYRGIVAHNTFAGLFAETGVIGIFILLFYPLRVVFGRKKQIQVIQKYFCYIYIVFFIQSISLSLENFRGLWLITGMYFNLLNSNVDEFNFIQLDTKNLKLVSKKYTVIIIIITVMLGIILYIDIGRKLQTNQNIVMNPLEQTIEVKSDERYLIRYKLVTKSDSNDNPAAKVILYKISLNENKRIKEYTYYNTDGFANIYINESGEYKLVVKGTGNKNTSATLKSIYLINKDDIKSLANFKYLSNWIQNALEKMDLLYLDKFYQNNRSNDFQYKEIKVNNIKIKKIKLNTVQTDQPLTIEYDIGNLEKIEKKYIIETLLTVEDINNIPSKYMRRNKHIFKKQSVIQKINDNSNKIIERFDIPSGKYQVEFRVYPLNKQERKKYSQKLIYVGECTLDRVELQEYLNNISDECLIIISVKDEATKALDENTLLYLNSFGLEADLKDKYRWSYLAILNKGRKLFEPIEMVAKKQLKYNLNKGDRIGQFKLDFDLEIISGGNKFGNISSIKIDGKEYSKNITGFNIVIYNTKTNQVEDSVNFNTHLKLYK